MTTSNSRTRALAALALLPMLSLIPTGLWAHALQEGSIPEHEAVIEGTPERIAVWFDHAMRVTLFEVTGPRGVVPLKAKPGRAAVTRFETAPVRAMPPGEYTVRWRGLAPDGHVMFDEFSFTVR